MIDQGRLSKWREASKHAPWIVWANEHPDWFYERIEGIVLSACSPSRPIDLSYLDDPNSWSLPDDTGVVWASDEERKAMWTHYCKPERTEIQTAHGQPCNWCDKEG